MIKNLINSWTPVYETNSIDAFIPEKWAAESIAILLENIVIAGLVHRNFENEIAAYGDVVNTRQPASFTAKRKSDTENVTIQNATATNIAVKLNQHFHTSFLIRDGQESKSFKSLVTEFLEPAVISIAQALDKVLLGQHVHFLDNNNAGLLGGLSSSNAKDYLLDTRKIMNDNKAPTANRNMILTSSAETTVLKDDDFTAAERVGDEGTALREASLGRKLGFNIFMCQSMSSIVNTDTNTADTIDNGNLIIGATTLTIDDAANCNIGDVITVAGDMTPQVIITVNDDSDAVPNTIVVYPGLKHVIVDGAAVTIYSGALIDGAEDIDFIGDVVINTLGSELPSVGQQIAIGTASVSASTDAKYTIIEIVSTAANTVTVRLDRPLDVAIVNDAIVSIYPTGEYNFAFVRNALALISRPLAKPIEGTGALSAVVNYDNLAIRVTITYDGDKQGHLVTVDLLCGVKVLDSDLGAVMLG